ncbi:MAG: glycosyltransferase [Candidatus Omnitrophota bacterium]
MENKQNSQLSTKLEMLGILVILVSMNYLIIRGVLLGKAKYGVTDGIFAFLVLLAEGFILFHGIGYSIAILWSQKKAKSMAAMARGAQLIAEREQPPVAIIIAARHEPREVLTETILTVNNIEYKNKRIYFLDDSDKEEYRKEAEELALEHGLTLFRRTKPRHGAKAGIINDFLEKMTEKYLVIFDADSDPMPDFLNPLVPLMEANEKLGFVQTPQFYTNIETNRIARAAVLQQAVFYEYICDGKGIVDSMFCCGTNVILRVSALRAIGGMHETTVTEDFATSFVLHTHGYSSLYYNHVCVFGMGPENLIAYFTQQFRWAAGTIHVFKMLVARFFTKPFSLKPGQWFQYFLSSTYYWVGLAYLILILGPLFYIFFKVPSFFIRPEVYFLSFLPYMILSLSIFYFSLRKRNYKPQDIITGQLLGSMAFYTHIKAALAALLGLKITFGITSKAKGGAVPYWVLWPQLTVLVATFAGAVWAVNRFVYEHEPALIMNSFWSFWNFMVFTSIFYFNAGTGSDLVIHRLRQGVKTDFEPLPVSMYETGTREVEWKECVEILTQRSLSKGDKVLCKVWKEKEPPIMFYGVAIVDAKKAWSGFYCAHLGLLTIPVAERERLTRWMKK